MAAEWARLVSSQVNPGGGILPKSHVRWLGERGQQPQLSPGASRLDHSSRSFPWLSKALGFLGHGSIFVNECGNNSLCSAESQGDFRLRSRLGFSLLAGTFQAQI
ncbi:hypothetical protein TNCV_1198111 [Trichonephila clavipes]|uniref:Uncharacterized protein n=1 Tax=Trichonephila clavipes TaxID=2585209 RepID=A0A8X6S3A9_TRICX|nr:hypothetical protein TNCV_1198111 [Trichonephila clavipes]